MKTLSVVNVVESSIARNSDFVLPIHCGAEIGVASTKAFTGQMLVLYILTLKISFVREDIKKKDFEKLGKKVFVLTLFDDVQIKAFGDNLVKILRS